MLNDYIDGSLDRARRETVEEHLSGCPSCMEELEHLRAVRGEIGSLSRVSAPPGFLQSIHRRLEKEEKPRFSLRAIFTPIRVRVQVGFAALATAAIALIFVLNLTAPQKKVRQSVERSALPLEEMGEKREEALPEEHMEAAEGASPVEEMSEPVEQERVTEKKDEAGDLRTEEIPAGKEVRLSAAPDREEPASAAAKRAEPSPDISLTRVEPVVIGLLLRPEEYDRSMTETYREESRAEGTKSRDAGMLAAEEEKGGLTGEMVLGEGRAEAPAVPEQAALFSIEDMVSAAGGKIISLDYGEREDLPRSVTVEVPLSKVEDLIESLMQLGQIDLPEIIRTGDYRSQITDDETALSIKINFE